jgi:hypothetical protein
MARYFRCSHDAMQTDCYARYFLQRNITADRRACMETEVLDIQAMMYHRYMSFESVCGVSHRIFKFIEGCSSNRSGPDKIPWVELHIVPDLNWWLWNHWCDYCIPSDATATWRVIQDICGDFMKAFHATLPSRPHTDVACYFCKVSRTRPRTTATNAMQYMPFSQNVHEEHGCTTRQAQRLVHLSTFRLQKALPLSYTEQRRGVSPRALNGPYENVFPDPLENWCGNIRVDPHGTARRYTPTLTHCCVPGLEQSESWDVRGIL